jgi:hypothetical protein
MGIPSSSSSVAIVTERAERMNLLVQIPAKPRPKSERVRAELKRLDIMTIC